jgi:hypothetical protein
MIKYAAEISTGFVNQIIVGNFVWANENLNGKWVDCTCGDEPCAGMGWGWDGENFTEPPVEPLA